jgi:hypothetical protein
MKPTFMKMTIRGALAALLLGTAGLLLHASAADQNGKTAPHAQGGALQCTNATISGTYGAQLQGTRPVPACLGGGMESVIGVVTRTYDGAGNFTQIDNVKGSVTGITPDRTGAGTYQVSPNCTAVTQFVPGPGLLIEERMVIVQNSGELRTIVSNPLGVMVSSVSERIDRR